MHNFAYETFYDLCKKMHLLQQNTAEYNRAPHHTTNTTTLNICNFKNSKIII